MILDLVPNSSAKSKIIRRPQPGRPVKWWRQTSKGGVPEGALSRGCRLGRLSAPDSDRPGLGCAVRDSGGSHSVAPSHKVRQGQGPCVDGLARTSTGYRCHRLVARSKRVEPPHV